MGATSERRTVSVVEMAKILGLSRSGAYEAVAAIEQEAGARIAERCRELDIPPEFAPGLHVGWYGRGENAAARRRAELRKVAQTRLEAEGRKAKLAVESASLDMLTTLAAGALASVEAQKFLESMPTPEALMPALELRELESGSARAKGPGSQRQRPW